MPPSEEEPSVAVGWGGHSAPLYLSLGRASGLQKTVFTAPRVLESEQRKK